jgi:tetratricopeptide (TPR) repeat protein
LQLDKPCALRPANGESKMFREAKPNLTIMKRYLITATLLLFVLISLAQPKGKVTYYCTYYGENAVLSQLTICLAQGHMPGLIKHDRAENMLDRIMTEVGLPRNFILVECDGYKNCSAINLEGLTGSLRYVLYGNAFLKEIDSTSKTYWASISIFAHEIGHHLCGHTLDMLGSRPDKELEADRFSGFVMFKLGATLEQAQAAMVAIGDPPYVSTHPPLANRLAAIRNGWNAGWQSNYRQTNRGVTMPHLKSIDDIAGELYDDTYLFNATGKYEDAIRTANAAINLRKNYADAYCQRGLAEASLARTSKAVKTLDSALKINPKLALAHAYKGKAYAIARQYALAELAFSQAVSADVGLAATYAERAIMRNDQGRYDDAIRDAGKAILLNYKDIYVPYATQGYAYFQKKDYVMAYNKFAVSIYYNRIYPFAAEWLEKSYQKLTPEQKKLVSK